MDKRKLNERKFKEWRQLENGEREYKMEIFGRTGWKAVYVKVVDEKENTLEFYQEIYNADNQLVEIHEKYPIDKGHKKL